MLGIQREDPPAQSQRFDQLLGGRDLVGLLLDRDMPEDELLGMGKRAQYLRRPLVGHGIKAALERLAIDGDTVLGVVTLRGQRRTMRSKRGFHCFGRELDEGIADGRMGRCPLPLEPQPGVEPHAVGSGEARDLAVGIGSGEHREHRDEEQRRQRVQPPLRPARINDGLQTFE